MVYGLLGRTLRHSYSPQIHALLGDYEYRLFEVEPQDLEAFLKKREFGGINVTIPYKKDVLPYLSGISDNAKRIGAVNTIIVKEDGGLYGDNTDYDGFLCLVQKSGFQVKGKKALVLGTGGASLPISAVLSDLGAREVVFISRSGENNYQNLSRHADADLIVNTTPVGMYPNNLKAPLSLSEFPNLSGVLDIVYNPQKTKLILDAERLGIPAYSGLLMLVAQGKRAAELFLGHDIPDSETDRIFKKLSTEMQNIVLVGMPGCGKTTVGKALAEQLNRPFFDADEEILKRTGKSAEAWIEACGEAVFRQKETEVLESLCKQSGTVIATGGGAVTVPENADILRQNSIVFFINRDVSALPVEGRPLSKATALSEMYEVRLPLYRSVCDKEIAADGSVQAVVRRILEELQ
ncbi:MAG TPA: AAA family ATPase [Candidatus Fimenecus excrementavium]|nr:AAA family ATPase [Candidatus Fimenecus excrementavium]